MPNQIRLILILVLATFVATAHAPAIFADNKDKDSSNSDDKKDKKDKSSNNDSNRDRDRRNSDDKKVGSGQVIQKAQQANSDKQKQNNSDKQKSNSDKQNQNKSDKQNSNSDKQKNSNNPPPIIINNGPKNGGGQQSGQGQNANKLPFNPKQPFPNNQNPNNQNPNNQNPNNKLPPNFPKPNDKDKDKDKDKNKDKWQYQSNKNKWQNQKHKDNKELNKWVDNFGGPKPFSSKWYKDHPKAWHHNHHDHDNAWKYATFAGIGGFLGWQAYHNHGPVYVYQPVSYDRLFVQRPGVVIDPSRGDWMPLGVYALMVSPGDENTRMLDLAVDRFGNIRGSYYDMISGATYNVAGIIDSRSQYAQWSLESNRDLTFFTPVGEMMQPQGYVEVSLPSGQRQQWQLVRMESNN